jgi:hypothetical protein
MNGTGNGGAGGLGNNIFGAGRPGDGGAGGFCGGILTVSTNVVIVRNTLIALNTLGAGGPAGTNIVITEGSATLETPGAPGTFPDVEGSFISGEFNLVGIVDGSTGFGTGSYIDLLGNLASPLDPLIGPLQINGGSTPTHALLPGSPAIDQGYRFNIRKDQSGHRRTVNNPSIPNTRGGDGTDIGACEFFSRK